ncbi:MAG: GGDEF domain-containing protein [Gammaproteobacteria bacterium]|nr:GGDEF domain-containing protein [Gammaproteobacteria bacterium]
MDNYTLYIVLISVLLVQAVALYQSWRLNREETGVRAWAFAAVLMSVASLIQAFKMSIYPVGTELEVSVPSQLLASVGNTFVVASWVLVLQGVQHFFRARAIKYSSMFLFSIAICLLMMLEIIMELPQGWRIFCVSVVVATFSILTSRELYIRGDRRSSTVLMLILVLVATAIIWSLRALVMLDMSPFDISRETIAAISLYNAIMGSIAFTVTMILLINERINEQLRLQATRDPLTGALNRRAFFENAGPLLSDLKRKECSVAVCLIDLDNFKVINDNHGHTVGDLALKRFVDIASDNLREGDLFARYGGEEFAMLLRDSPKENTAQVLNRLRDAFSQKFNYADDISLRVTFSVGVCQINGPSRIDIDSLLDKADNALYLAKDQGRDCVEFAAIVK